MEIYGSLSVLLGGAEQMYIIDQRYDYKLKMRIGGGYGKTGSLCYSKRLHI